MKPVRVEHVISPAPKTSPSPAFGADEPQESTQQSHNAFLRCIIEHRGDTPKDLLCLGCGTRLYLQFSTMLDIFNLSGKTALVTGAARGIGQAIAVGLAEAGADIILVLVRESPSCISRFAKVL